MTSASVWHACRKYLHARQTPTKDQVAWTIACCFTRIRRCHYGSSAKAKRKQKRAQDQLRRIKNFMSKHPIRYEVATDGSSFGNPGQSGAGFFMREVGSGAGLLTHYRSVYLGEGTNNHAELVAVDEALSQLQSLIGQLDVRSTITFLVDNRMALNVATGAGTSRSFPKLAFRITQKVKSITAVHWIHFIWAPAHAGLDINEVADMLAKRGASGISSWHPLNPAPESDNVSTSFSSLEKELDELRDLDHELKRGLNLPR
jgi:ribonuclease HI